MIGIAEAAMHAATLVGRRFAVVTTLGRTTARARELVDRYGFRDACVAVRACEVPVLALEDPAPARGSSTSAGARSSRTAPTWSSSAAPAWPSCAR